MKSSLKLFIAFLFVGTALASQKGQKETFDEERQLDERQIKRQAEYNIPPPGAQFAPQQEVPPEFLNYLQQLSEQQAAALPGAPPPQPQPQPQQLLAGRGPPPPPQVPQQVQPVFSNYRIPQGAGGPPPPEARLSPQAQEQRRLQQEYADRALREQQQRALQQLFQPAGGPPPFRPIPQLTAAAAGPGPAQRAPPQPQYSQEELRALAEQQYISYEQPQYIPEQALIRSQPQPQPQQPQAQQQTLPKFSYSQIQFGGPQPTHQRVKSQAPSQQRPLVYAQQPQPQQQPEYFPIAFDQQTPTQPQLPEQYLIETSKPQGQPSGERIVSIPRPKSQLPHHQQQQQPTQSLYYRAQQLQAAQSVPRYAEDNVLRPTTPSPSRSSIYVTKGGQENKPLYTLGETLQQTFSGVGQLRFPDNSPAAGQHPLSQNELNSLLQAGFQVSPATDGRKTGTTYLSGPTYLRPATSKRQNKRVPSPVQLTEEERQALAEQGIRNLYRVESAESQDSPVTYVLALDNASLGKSGNSDEISSSRHHSRRSS